MLTALPPSNAVALEDDRPIVLGRIDQPDYYVLAHEAKNRGCHLDAATLLRFAAQQLNIHYGFYGDPHVEWDLHVEVIDRAWGERQVLSTANPKPARDRLRVMPVNPHDPFIDAVFCYEHDRLVCASIMLQVIARTLKVEGDWSGTVEQDWERNFDAVHRAWVEFQAARHD